MNQAVPPRAASTFPRSQMVRSLLVPLALLLISSLASAEPMVLDYLARYDHQPSGPDHIMDAIEVPGGRAIVCSNLGLTLIDLDALPAGGSDAYIHRLEGLNARDIIEGEGLYYVNLHRQGTAMSMGLAVVKLVGDDLQLVRSLDETGVLYEKMCVANGHLFVAAHRNGLRVFSLEDPENPQLLSSLTSGFDDAFAVAVEGDLAYVADGPGGLKIVDVSDPALPVHIGGESMESAVGTAEDLLWGDGTLYVALGGEGLGVYPGGDPAARTILPLDGCAESLCWIGEHLALGTTGGAVVIDVDPAPVLVAAETAHRRGPGADLRISSGVAAATGARLLCANWDYLDVYALRDFEAGDQPDIQCDRQRIRFHYGGGSETVTLSNAGAQDLVVSSVDVSPASFTVGYSGGTLTPGASVSFEIAYNGAPFQGSGKALLHSNDPDESPLPIQLFGNTSYLDPGEEAPDFTLPLFRVNPETGEFEGDSFTLSEHEGKVVWFQIFGTW